VRGLRQTREQSYLLFVEDGLVLVDREAVGLVGVGQVGVGQVEVGQVGVVRYFEVVVVVV